MTRAELLPLMRRTAEIDFQFKHRHLPGSLTALPIIAGIFQNFDESKDVFILSKGHSCAALYAVLESRGKQPDLTKVHPERDVKNGIEITAGSLGHGLPIAMGSAYAKKLRGESGCVYVLIGDGECLEGTTWEALHLAQRLNLQGGLRVQIDANGYQGSNRTLCPCGLNAWSLFPDFVFGRFATDDFRLNFFASMPEKSVHLQSEEDHQKIMEELS